MKTQVLEQAGLSVYAILAILVIVVGILLEVGNRIYRSRNQIEERGLSREFMIALTVAVVATGLGVGGNIFNYSGVVTVTAVESQGTGRVIEVEESNQTFYINRDSRVIFRPGDVLELKCDSPSGDYCTKATPKD